MIVCVILVVFVACLSENRLDDYQSEYKRTATGYLTQIEALEEEVKALTEENGELERKVRENDALSSKLETGNQALSDMKEIYELYKSGSQSEARTRFSKIEPIGFDDASLAYYELLKDFLN